MADQKLQIGTVIFVKKPIQEAKIISKYLYRKRGTERKLAMKLAFDEIKERYRSPEYFCKVEDKTFVLHKDLIQEFANKPVEIIKYFTLKEEKVFLASQVSFVRDVVKIILEGERLKVTINGIYIPRLEYRKYDSIRPNQMVSRLQAMTNPFGFQEPDREQNLITIYTKHVYGLYKKTK